VQRAWRGAPTEIGGYQPFRWAARVGFNIQGSYSKLIWMPMCVPELRHPPFQDVCEREFYSSYEWCLNPILSLRELLQRLSEELDRYSSSRVKWQQQENVVNLHLFACAISCMVDDYLAWRPWVLSRISERYSKLRWIVPFVQWIVNIPHTIRSLLSHRPVLLWKRQWDQYVDEICRILASEQKLSNTSLSNLQAELESLTVVSLPENLLRRRMKIHEGFRCQDLTHHDVFTMVRRFVATNPDSGRRHVVIGPRTAGAYFAPLVKAYLSMLGWPKVSWMTIRPKRGLSRWEKQQLRKLLSPSASVILIDDYANTGQTLRTTQNILRRFGVQYRNMVVLAPTHPARPECAVVEDKRVRTILLQHNELYKKQLLDPRSVESLLRELFRELGWESIFIQENPCIEAINAQLWSHYADGFQVRLKRVYEVRLSRTNEESVVKKVLAKSVGWGWLGYHAYIAAVRLLQYVPPVIGLRNGFLFMEWLDKSEHEQIATDASTVKRLASYVACRVGSLRLKNDPRFEFPEYGWGWLEILSILRRSYGVNIGRFKDRVILHYLQHVVSPVPTLTDGRMQPDEWIRSKQEIYKTDFEHHNFGAPELDVVDPAYDLAAAMFEFRLSESEQQQLVQKYAQESEDQTISDRLFLYRLLYATVVKKRSAESVIRQRPRDTQEQLNRRYILSWNHLIYTMNQFWGSIAAGANSSSFNGPLFFMDLDGVFDTEILGFPHTTPSGLAALRRLQSKGYAIVLNTGRSVEHVRNYCSAYGLPGGIAEYGSVFLDTVHQQVIPLTDNETVEQLAHCREAILKVPGVFVDPGHQYSIRAYRYNGKRTVGLRAQEVDELLKQLGTQTLTFITHSDGTYIIQRAVGKASGSRKVKDILNRSDDAVAAIGDSDEDLSLLQESEFSYAPSNCSRMVRELAKKRKCRIMSQPRQRGLLAAVHDLVGTNSGAHDGASLVPNTIESFSDLMLRLLHAAEGSRICRILTLFNRRSL
jgi:hydroxymethylpyrimidine pyrophosphatase-like HAD family hydrolase